MNIPEKNGSDSRTRRIRSLGLLRRAFVDSLPVLMGYSTMGFAAGVLMGAKADVPFSPIWGFLTSTAFVSGTLSFAIVPLLSAGVPPWVGKLGKLISPVIIAALIIYSYSSLEWKTAAPYAAGALTVALHLLWRNPLASIIAGTALYMTLLRI